MKDSQSNNSRLSLFKTQRDNWKERALSKQKENRRLDSKLEYTAYSRDKWKKKAITAQKEIKNLQAILKQKNAEITALKKLYQLPN